MSQEAARTIGNVAFLALALKSTQVTLQAVESLAKGTKVKPVKRRRQGTPDLYKAIMGK